MREWWSAGDDADGAEPSEGGSGPANGPAGEAGSGLWDHCQRVGCDEFGRNGCTNGLGAGFFDQLLLFFRAQCLVGLPFRSAVYGRFFLCLCKIQPGAFPFLWVERGPLGHAALQLRLLCRGEG